MAHWRCHHQKVCPPGRRRLPAFAMPAGLPACVHMPTSGMPALGCPLLPLCISPMAVLLYLPSSACCTATTVPPAGIYGEKNSDATIQFLNEVRRMQEDVRLRLQSERCMMQTKIVLLPMYTAPGLKVGVWVFVDL